MARLNQRKFLLTIGVICIASVALFIDKAEFPHWSDFVVWIVGLYITGNVGSKGVGKILEKEQTKKSL